MELRTVGKSGLSVSALGIGCWAFGGGAYWGDQPQQDVDAVVHRAIDLGINFFDTAEMYNDGTSETSLGIALKGRRSQVLVCSKVAPSNAAPANLRAHCEQSLRRLGTDHLDLYLMHWPITSRALPHFTSDPALIAAPPSTAEAYATLAALRQEGKIRAFGISNHGVKQMQAVLAVTDGVVVNQMAYSLLSRAIEASILPFCAQHEIALIADMPLAQGLLTGLFTSPDQMNPMQTRSRHFHHTRGKGTRHGEQGAEPEVFQAIAEIQELAASLHTNIAALSLAWVIAHRQVASTIVGCRTVAELEANVAGAAFAMNPDLCARLDAITQPVLDKVGSNPDYYEPRIDSRIA